MIKRLRVYGCSSKFLNYIRWLNFEHYHKPEVDFLEVVNIPVMFCQAFNNLEAASPVGYRVEVYL